MQICRDGELLPEGFSIGWARGPMLHYKVASWFFQFWFRLTWRPRLVWRFVKTGAWYYPR